MISFVNTLWDVTVRVTKANQRGLIGCGGENNGYYQVMTEAYAAVFFSQHLTVDVKYRQKPDNLGLGENNWLDVFISYIPNENLNFTLTWSLSI